jgi:uncharacterized metal-binding protein YceD (DUF177 family)
VKDYVINIVGLSNQKHAFRFEVNDSFFERHGRQMVESGDFGVDVMLDKHATFLEAFFEISGRARLVCDRSLEPFDQELEIRKKLIFKLGNETKEVSDEIVVIAHETAQLDLAQYIYEFVCLAVPMKRLHPRFRDEEDNPAEEGRLVYRTAPAAAQTDAAEEKTDPRWEKLKNLNIN